MTTISATTLANDAARLDRFPTDAADDADLTTAERLAGGRLDQPSGDADELLLAQSEGYKIRHDGTGAAVTLFSRGVLLLNDAANQYRADRDLEAMSPRISQELRDVDSGSAGGVLVEVFTENRRHPGPIYQEIYHGTRLLGAGDSPRDALDNFQGLEYIDPSWERSYLWVKPDGALNNAADGSDSSAAPIGRTEIRYESELPN